MTITPDIRFEYLEEIAAMILKFKPDKWTKLIGAEENLAMFTEFFEKADVTVLVLTLNPSGMIIPCLGFPESLKSKGVYFIKTKLDSVNKLNYKSLLLYGDISPAPVDQLIAVVEEVRAPGGREGLGPKLRSSLLLTPAGRSPGTAASPGNGSEMQTAPRPSRTWGVQG